MKGSDTGTEKGHLKHWSPNRLSPLRPFLFRKAFPPSSFHPDIPPKRFTYGGSSPQQTTQPKASCCQHLIAFRLFAWMCLFHFIFLLRLKSDPVLCPFHFPDPSDSRREQVPEAPAFAMRMKIKVAFVSACSALTRDIPISPARRRELKQTGSASRVQRGCGATGDAHRRLASDLPSPHRLRPLPRDTGGFPPPPAAPAQPPQRPPASPRSLAPGTPRPGGAGGGRRTFALTLRRRLRPRDAGRCCCRRRGSSGLSRAVLLLSFLSLPAGRPAGAATGCAPPPPAYPPAPPGQETASSARNFPSECGEVHGRGGQDRTPPAFPLPPPRGDAPPSPPPTPTETRVYPSQPDSPEGALRHVLRDALSSSSSSSSVRAPPSGSAPTAAGGGGGGHSGESAADGTGRGGNPGTKVGLYRGVPSGRSRGAAGRRRATAPSPGLSCPAGWELLAGVGGEAVGVARDCPKSVPHPPGGRGDMWSLRSHPAAWLGKVGWSA